MHVTFSRASTRIIATGAIAALLLLALFAFIARTATQRIVLADLDDELETLSIAIASDLETRGVQDVPHDALRSGVEANMLAFRLEHHSALLFDATRVIAATGDLARRAKLPALLPFTRHDERSFTAAEPFTGHHRLCRFRVTHLGQAASGATLLVFRPIEAAQRTLDTVDRALALLVLVGSAATALVLAFAVRRALRPVENITTFAERVTARELSARVTVRAAGDEFRRLGDVINSLLERLEASFAAQQRLVSDAAHELKTPTAVIAAEAQELARGRLAPDEARQSLEIIGRAAAGMAREVDDLLELARLDAAPQRPRETFELEEAIDEAVAMHAPAARERAIEIVRETRGGGAIEGDRAGIVRAIANLISNAVRYAPRASEVHIVHACDETACTIDVADRGPGVPESERRRIFERFVRLAPARREHPEGSGLGLAIVEQVVAAHGGAVAVLDRDGGGALFRMRLPTASSPRPSSSSSPRSSSQPSPASQPAPSAR
ncbi:MAG TPA: ATP-binding protein [Thermoanaerobaculia bacterium]|jgi:signal transduction histidine kinase